MPATAPTNWPITVAMAAPRVPISSTQMKTGSRIRLVTEAADSVNRKSRDLPLAMTKRSNTHCIIWPREKYRHTVR